MPLRSHKIPYVNIYLRLLAHRLTALKFCQAWAHRHRRRPDGSSGMSGWLSFPLTTESSIPTVISTSEESMSSRQSRLADASSRETRHVVQPGGGPRTM